MTASTDKMESNRPTGDGSDELIGDEIVVVSGLPRSGTSMLMRMLRAGGLEIVTDNQRTRDIDNPNGYFEFERVKALDKGDTAWLPDAQGKAVKVISALLQHLPDGYRYRVLFIHRHLDEILASQQKMLQRRGETSHVDDAQMAAIYRSHLQAVQRQLQQQDRFSVLEVAYHEIIADPTAEAEKINRFLGGKLDVQEMAAAVDPRLHRNRSPAHS